MASSESKPQSTSSESYITARNLFFHKIVKWFYQDLDPSQIPETSTEIPDFHALVCLLQTIGFDLQCTEQLSGASRSNSSHELETSYTVNVACTQSGLQAVLKSRPHVPVFSNPEHVTNREGSESRQSTSSCLPVVLPGIALVVREVVMQLISLMLSGGEETVDYARRYSFPLLSQENVYGFHGNPSVRTSSPIEKSDKMNANSLEDIQIDTQNLPACKEPLSTATEVSHLSSNTSGPPELVRQRTWVREDTNTKDDASLSPVRTFSPIVQDQMLNTLGELNLRDGDVDITQCLQDACSKIRDALTILNTSRDNTDPMCVVQHTPKSKTEPKSTSKETCTKVKKPRPVQTPIAKYSNTPSQNTGAIKKQRTSTPTKFILEREGLATPSKTNQARGISPIAISSLKSRRSSLITRSTSSLAMSPTTQGSLSQSVPKNSSFNIASKCNASKSSINCNVPVATTKSRRDFKSVVRPSMLKVPAIINKFKI